MNCPGKRAGRIPSAWATSGLCKFCREEKNKVIKYVYLNCRSPRTLVLF